MAKSRICIGRYFRRKVANPSVSLHKRFVKAAQSVETFSVSGKVKANNIYKATGKSANLYLKLWVHSSNKVWRFQKKRKDKIDRTKIGIGLATPAQMAIDKSYQYTTTLKRGVGPKNRKRHRAMTVRELCAKKIKLERYATAYFEGF